MRKRWLGSVTKLVQEIYRSHFCLARGAKGFLLPNSHAKLASRVEGLSSSVEGEEMQHNDDRKRTNRISSSLPESQTKISSAVSEKGVIQGSLFQKKGVRTASGRGCDSRCPAIPACGCHRQRGCHARECPSSCPPVPDCATVPADNYV